MKTIAFFPEAAFGPALNSVGIAQQVEKLGHKAVFICDKGFEGVFKGITPFGEAILEKDGTLTKVLTGSLRYR